MTPPPPSSPHEPDPPKAPLKIRWRAWRDRMTNQFRRPDWLEGNIARRDRAAHRFQRPAWMDREHKWRDRAAQWLQRPAWMDRVKKSKPSPLQRPDWLDRVKNDKPSRLTRPDWLDRVDRKDRPTRELPLPGWLHRPQWSTRVWVTVSASLTVILLIMASLIYATTRPENVSSQEGNPALTPIVPVTQPTNGLDLSEIAQINGAAVATAIRPGDKRLYVAQRDGEILAVDTTSRLSDFRRAAEPVMNLQGSISTGTERGLLGLAFTTDGRGVFVSMSDPDGTFRVVEYPVAKDGSMAPRSGRTILAIPHPDDTGYGHSLHTDPQGNLWIPTGAGGNPVVGAGSAQSLAMFEGSILRIKPLPLSAPASGPAYSIPRDNPYVKTPGALPEIWAKGLREPSLSFDQPTADLWVTDLGSSYADEITLLRGSQGRGKGANLGWDLAEADLVYRALPPSNVVNPSIVLPFAGQNSGNCATTPGSVYRGTAMKSIKGYYLYSTGCSDAVTGALVAPDNSVIQDLVIKLPNTGTDTQSANTDSASGNASDAAQVSTDTVTFVGAGPQGDPIVITAAGIIYKMIADPAGTLPILSPTPKAIGNPAAPSICSLPQAIVVLSWLDGKSPIVVRQIVEDLDRSLQVYKTQVPKDLAKPVNDVISTTQQAITTLQANNYDSSSTAWKDLYASIRRQVTRGGYNPFNVTAEQLRTRRICTDPVTLQLGR